MLYILTYKSARETYAWLYDNRVDAISEAVRLMGTHNPDDGCSTEPSISDYNNVYRIRRSSSWGNHSAIVQPISYQTAQFRTL